jgi:hypothetical protein
VTGSVTINLADIVRKQGVPDKCDYCGEEFVWLLSCSPPLCPRCLMMQPRDAKQIKALRERWESLL